MKLFHVAGYGFPDGRAYSFQIARMSCGFLDCGVNSWLVYPGSSGKIAWDRVPEMYGVPRVAERQLLRDGVIRVKGRVRGRRPFILRLSLYRLARQSGAGDVFFVRHPGFDPGASLLRLKARGVLRGKVFVDLHEARHYSTVNESHVSGYVVTNQLLRGFLRSAGVADHRILVAPHAVDLHTYERGHRLDRRRLRSDLGVADGQVAICYTGQVRASKNVGSLIDALHQLDERVVLLVVGGAIEEHLARVREYAEAQGLSSRVRFLGQQCTLTVQRVQFASDVLVIPHDTYLFDLMLGAPLKLPEYRATGLPIVAFPSAPLREGLCDDEVVWAADDTPHSLARAIEQALTRQPRSFEEVSRRMGGWTWADRARCVAGFMGFPGRA